MTHPLEKHALWQAACVYATEQDSSRGDWASPCRSKMPNPPWPTTDNPVLRALLDQARGHVEDKGVDAALLHLATHCWFEGGIEGYDRGQRDARSELAD